jgi:molecular chaperone GrpE
MTRTWWDNEAIVAQVRRWLSETAQEVHEPADEVEDSLAEEKFDDAPTSWEFAAGEPLRKLVADDAHPLEDAFTAGQAEDFEDDDETAAVESLPQVGLLEVVESLTAMRHELKLQTKSSRGLESIVEQARQGLDVAIREFHSVRARENEAAERAVLPVVEALAGLHEALVRGVHAFRVGQDQLAEALSRRLGETLQQQHRCAPFWRRWFSAAWLGEAQRRCEEAARQTAAEEIGRLREGYELMLRRLQRDMMRQGVQRVETVGRRVDPQLMTVVELVEDAQAEPETVVEELRPGYLYGDKVIRFAEVKATAARRTEIERSSAVEDYAEN